MVKLYRATLKMVKLYRARRPACRKGMPVAHEPRQHAQRLYMVDGPCRLVLEIYTYNILAFIRVQLPASIIHAVLHVPFGGPLFRCARAGPWIA